jgi:hypothetical protein
VVIVGGMVKLKPLKSRQKINKNKYINIKINIKCLHTLKNYIIESCFIAL